MSHMFYNTEPDSPTKTLYVCTFALIMALLSTSIFIIYAYIPVFVWIFKPFVVSLRKVKDNDSLCWVCYMDENWIK